MKNTRELNTILTAIHEKDKKQIYTAMITAEIFALLLLALIINSLRQSTAVLPTYLYLVLGLIAVGPLVPFVIMLIQAKKRPQKIADFISRLEKGETISNVNTYTDYKLILPLRLIRIRLFPMEYAQVVIGPGRQSFKLPLSEENVQPFRAFISGPVDTVPGNSSSANWSAN